MEQFHVKKDTDLAISNFEISMVCKVSMVKRVLIVNKVEVIVIYSSMELFVKFTTLYKWLCRIKGKKLLRRFCLDLALQLFKN